MNAERPYKVAFLLLPQFSLLAFASASDPLRIANRMAQKTLYEWWTLSIDGEPVACSSHLEMVVQMPMSTSPKPDLLVVVASFEPHKVIDTRLLHWLKTQATSGVCIAGVDTGPWIMAKAGLLNGRRATMHWEHLHIFAEDFPGIQIARDLYILEPQRYTAAGGSACVDMMLHLIERDYGSKVATATADQLIYTRLRSPQDSQKLALAERLKTHNPKVLKSVALMEAHLCDPLSASELAAQVSVSQRELERLFRRHLQLTPAHYYRNLRLQHAKMLLMQTERCLSDIAEICGFSTLSSFTRAYKRLFGHSPSCERGPPPTN